MAVVIGLVVGLILGLTGAGGSTLAVPLLMWTLGLSLTQAAPLSLSAISCAATIGAAIAWRQARLRYRAGLLMGGLGLLAAPIGVALAQHTPPKILELLFAGVMTVVALRMLLQARRSPDDARTVRANIGDPAADDGALPCRVNPDTGRIHWTLRCTSALAAIGAGTGFLSGLLGVGGGFVVVPGLRASSDLSMPAAVATSLMVMAIISGGTAAMHFAHGGALLSRIGLWFAGGAIVGMLAGTLLAPRVAGAKLQQAFGITMLLAAALMAAKALGVG
ncbi:MAG TPA: sulfite exporter TauE/SafE family protein [Nevskiaceae bacterium]|nr:sulfite exporter TauE/SafE family protein [Nevskiaceae bacterium]